MFKKMLIIVFLIPFVFGFIGCESKGPAEKAGEKIDETVEKAGDKAEEAAEAVKDKAEDVKEKAKDTAEKVN